MSVSRCTLVISDLKVYSNAPRSSFRRYPWGTCAVTSVNFSRLSTADLLPADAGDHFRHLDARQARLAAAAAANAKSFFICLHEAAVLVIIAVFEAGVPFGPEV